MKRLLIASVGLLIAAVPVTLEREAPPAPLTPPDSVDVCATGCSSVPDSSARLSQGEYRDLLAAFAIQPPNATSEAFETLLFHGADTRALIDEVGLSRLDEGRRALLRSELTRTHAWLDVRILDEDGIERLRLGRKRIPLGEKQHIFPSHTEELQPPEVSGTVKRVGLRHLWARL